jgi:L-threonylcarbamoyladenylate synthase
MTPHILTPTDAASHEASLQQASDIISRGGVIVCATDTGYLLGVDGLNTHAVQKIYQIKGRSFDKPIHLVVSDLEMAKMLAEFTPQAEAFFTQLLPGPLTLILKKTARVPEILVSGLPTIGLRMPEGEWLLELVRRTGTPITATSANQSGKASPFTTKEVLTELGEAVGYVDLIIDHGQTPHTTPSTLLDLTSVPPRILREGPVTRRMLAGIVGF